MKKYRVVRVAFDITGWIEDEPKKFEEGDYQIENETAPDLFMVGEWDEEINNYYLSPLDEVYETWEEAAKKVRELESNPEN